MIPLSILGVALCYALYRIHKWVKVVDETKKPQNTRCNGCIDPEKDI